MRILALTRGIPGSGKSTWIKQSNLEQYTLCPDTIRLMVQSPVLTVDGGIGISQKNDRYVWELLYTLLEQRMIRGELTVVDATHTSTSFMNKYKKLCEKYRYRCIVIDFSDVPLDIAKARNTSRLDSACSVYKYVPEHVLEMGNARLQALKPSGWYQVVSPCAFMESIAFKPLNFNKYSKIYHIGDLHGCYSALVSAFADNPAEYIRTHPDYMFIFTGDYIDRGIEHKELFSFIFDIYELDNVIFLEGNHEKWIWLWAINEVDSIKSKEFIYNTAPSLPNIAEFKKDIRKWYRSIRQIAYYQYDDKLVLVNHGGISTPIANMEFIASTEFINGVGKYEDDIDKMFTGKAANSVYQIHGHRNLYNIDANEYSNSFNLEGKIEFGGNLRIAILDSTGFSFEEHKQTVFKETLSTKIGDNTNPTIMELSTSKAIIRKHIVDDVYSFNFKRKTFHNKNWDNITTKARGLYVDVVNNEVIARAYNKFFYVDEIEETKKHNLLKNMTLNAEVYKKENGFLGLLSVYKRELFFATKSTNNNKFTEIFKTIFEKTFMGDLEELKSTIQGNTFVFEVIAPEDDPHIVNEDKDRIVLLDCVKNSFDFQLLPYRDLCKIAEKFGFGVKEHIRTITSFDELFNYLDKLKNTYINDDIEGIVVVANNNYMLKEKTGFYTFWKKMRNLKNNIVAGKPINTSRFVDSMSPYVYQFMLGYDRDELGKASIVDVRTRFLANNTERE